MARALGIATIITILNNIGQYRIEGMATIITILINIKQRGIEGIVKDKVISIREDSFLSYTYYSQLL